MIKVAAGVWMCEQRLLQSGLARSRPSRNPPNLVRDLGSQPRRELMFFREDPGERIFGNIGNRLLAHVHFHKIETAAHELNQITSLGALLDYIMIAWRVPDVGCVAGTGYVSRSTQTIMNQLSCLPLLKQLMPTIVSMILM